MSPSAEYVVCTTAGLEDLAADAIAEALHLPRFSVRQVGQPAADQQWCDDPALSRGLFLGAAGVAKLAFALPRPTSRAGWAAQHAALAALPCVSGLLAPLELRSGIPLGAQGGLEALSEAATAGASGRWRDALATWRHCRAATPPPTPDGALSFRVSCTRDGRHKYTSTRAAAVIGDAVGSATGLRVDLTAHDVEVCALLLQGELVLGINLWHGRAASWARGELGPEPCPLLPAARSSARLRPATAALMLRLARVRPGDTLLDPMCGIGTLPVLAAAVAGCALALGGDVDDEGLAQADENARAYAAAHARGPAADAEGGRGEGGEGGPDEPLGALALQPSAVLPAWQCEAKRYARRRAAGAVGLCLWSAAELPLRDATVDVVAVDLPFGMAHRVRGQGGIYGLYLRSTLQCARVLREGGRMVMLTTTRRYLVEALEAQAALWEELEARPVNCGGAIAWVVLWRRTAELMGQRVANPVPKKLRKGRGEVAQHAGQAVQHAGSPAPGAGLGRLTRKEKRKVQREKRWGAEEVEAEAEREAEEEAVVVCSPSSATAVELSIQLPRREEGEQRGGVQGGVEEVREAREGWWGGWMGELVRDFVSCRGWMGQWF